LGSGFTFIVGLCFAAATARRHRRRRSAFVQFVVVVAVQPENASNVDRRDVEMLHRRRRRRRRRRRVVDVKVWRRRDGLERTRAARCSLNERSSTFDHNLKRQFAILIRREWLERYTPIPRKSRSSNPLSGNCHELFYFPKTGAKGSFTPKNTPNRR